MNSQKKRNFLIAFGGVAVVLVAVFATWPPAFLSEDASGAIGAVQKHRELQITAKDVVLVDEATRREEAILYADYLKDAGELENISVALRNSVDTLEARSTASRNLQGHVADLQSRYRLGMSDALNAASQVLVRNANALSARQIAGVQSDIDSLSAKIQARQELGDEEMAALNSRLRSISEQMEARTRGVRSLELENIEMALGSELAFLEKASRLESEALLDAKATRIESLSRDIQEARSTVDARQRLNHLGELVLELRALENAENLIEAFSRDQLGQDAALASRLRSASDDLAGHASRFESQAIDNMESRLKAQDEMAARIKSMDSILESARKALAGRSEVESRFSKALGSFDDDLQALNVRIQARIAAGIQSELGAIAARLDSRQLSAKLQDESQLEARNLQVESQLEARQIQARIQSRSDLGARLQGHLGALTRALDAKSNIGASLRDQAELGKQARALQNRADIELQARQK